MNNISISNALHVLSVVADCIFSGLKFVIPFLFFLHLLLSHFQQKYHRVILTANILLLCGGIIFLATIILNTTRAWLSGNDSEQNFIFGFLTGPHWYQVVIPLVNFGLLPHFMWFRQLRNKITASFVVVFCWLVSSFIENFFSNKTGNTHSLHSSKEDFPFNEYAWKAVLFFALFSIVYLIIRRKQNQMLLNENTSIPENRN